MTRTSTKYSEEHEEHSDFGRGTEPTSSFIKLLLISANFPLTICPFRMSQSQIPAVRLHPAFVWQAHCGAPFWFMLVSKARCRDMHFCSGTTWASVKGRTTRLLCPKKHVDTYSDNMGTVEAPTVMDYLLNGFMVYGVIHFGGTWIYVLFCVPFPLLWSCAS